MMRYSDYIEISELVELAILEFNESKSPIYTLQTVLRKLEHQQTKRPGTTQG